MNIRMAQDVKVLIRSLNSCENRVRAEAAKSISSLAKEGTSDVASIKPLISLLFDSDKSVRHNAAFAIGDLAEYCGVFDSSAVLPLQRLLSDGDEIVRWSATFALKTYAKKSDFDADSVQSFAVLLLDANKRVRYNAALGIGYLAKFGAFDKSTIYPLIALLSDHNGIVRGSAAFAIGCLAKQDVYDVAAIKKLFSLLSDYNGIVRKNAAEALKEFQEKNIVSNDDLNNDKIVQIHIGDKIGTQVKDSVVLRSTIGAGARKCPDCGKAVEANEKFCVECGARL